MKLKIFIATNLMLVGSCVFASAMDDLSANIALDPKPALPMVNLPSPLTFNDKEAIKEISKVSVVPVKRGVFPRYQPKSSEDEHLDLSAWSLAEFKKYEALTEKSEAFRQLLFQQTIPLQAAVGRNINGVISQLRWRAAGIPTDWKVIDVDADNLDSLKRASGAEWSKIAGNFKKVSGNHSMSLEAARLKTQLGTIEANEVVKKFSAIESEKGRPHEVLMFGLPDENEESWVKTFIFLKSKLKPLGFETFALEHTPRRKFFADLGQAQSFAKTLNPKAHAQIVEEGPAVLILDKNAIVISTQGKVSKRELDAATKQKLAGMNQMLGFVNQFSDAKYGVANLDSGSRFQFVNYPANWFPPGAELSQIDDGQLKVEVPLRYSVCYAYQGAFAIKNFDRYRYLDAQGVNAINYGMSHKDVETHLKQLDHDYGLEIITADYDGLTAKILRLPSDLNAFVKQEKNFCPDMDEAQVKNQLKANGTINYWWD